MNTKASVLRRKARAEAAQKPPAKPLQKPATNDLVLSDVTIPPSKLPSPWLYDTQCLLRDLDRFRELVLCIPHHNDNHGPINVLLSAIWDVRQTIQFVIGLHQGMQHSWRQKTSAQPNNDLPNQDAGRQTDTRTVNARRRHAARVA